MFSSDRFENAIEEEEFEGVPRYGAIRIEDGSVVVYDRDDEDAWIRSDYSVEIGERG